MNDHEDGQPLEHLAREIGDRGWQLVPTRWHRQGDRAANTPIRGVTGAAPFRSTEEMVEQCAGLVLHREGGPDCVRRHAKPAVRPPVHVTLFDIDDGYSGKHGGDSIVEAEMMLGPLPGTFSVTARGPWQPSRRMAFRHPAGLVISDAFFGQFGGNVETIRTGHRFSWTSPAIHTRRGQVVGPVRWYDADHEVVTLPHVDDLAELPESWVQAIREHRPTRHAVQERPAGARTRVVEGYADAVVGKLAQRLHELAPTGGEFRNTVFGLACALARREAARGGSREAAMDQLEELFREHPLNLRMDSDDLRWAGEGTDTGWADPWEFIDTDFADLLPPAHMRQQTGTPTRPATARSVAGLVSVVLRAEPADRAAKLQWATRRLYEQAAAGHLAVGTVRKLVDRLALAEQDEGVHV